MVAKYNTRITITLQKTIVKRLRKCAKYTHESITKLITDCILPFIEETEQKIHWNALSESEKYYLQKELQEQIRIAKTPWLDSDD